MHLSSVNALPLVLYLHLCILLLIVSQRNGIIRKSTYNRGDNCGKAGQWVYDKICTFVSKRAYLIRLEKQLHTCIKICGCSGINICLCMTICLPSQSMICSARESTSLERRYIRQQQMYLFSLSLTSKRSRQANHYQELVLV